MRPDVQEALGKLNKDQLNAVMTATKARAARAAKSGFPVDQIYVERCLVEYSEDVIKQRDLDQAGVVEVALSARNFADQYASPKKDN